MWDQTKKNQKNRKKQKKQKKWLVASTTCADAA